jgi:hypothetical protein
MGQYMAQLRMRMERKQKIAQLRAMVEEKLQGHKRQKLDDVGTALAPPCFESAPVDAPKVNST